MKALLNARANAAIRNNDALRPVDIALSAVVPLLSAASTTAAFDVREAKRSSMGLRVVTSTVRICQETIPQSKKLSILQVSATVNLDSYWKTMEN